MSKAVPQSPATPMEHGHAQQATPSQTQTPSGHPAPPKSSRGSVAAESVPWKSEAEETVKTRKNALRVIVSKFRNFWPRDDENRLTERASELEKGVYDTTNSKHDYIQRLQKDLGVLGQKKELEKKTMRIMLQTSGDVFATLERDEKTVYQMSADAKAKFGQKIHSMEKKHQQLFVLLKQPDDRMKTSPEAQMKQIVSNFKTLAAMRDKGPYDVERLNQINGQLDQYRQMALQRARQGQSRESVDKQNDRTNQVGGRALEKLRRLNKDKPFIVTDLGWTMQEGIPSVKEPPELEVKRKSAASKRPPSELGAQDRGAKYARNGEPDGGYFPSVRPFRSKGGDCIPSVRESHPTFPGQGSRGKGWIDLDVANDGDHDATTAEGVFTMSSSVEPVLEQLHHLLQTLKHDLLFPSEQDEHSSDTYTIKQKKPSRSGDGNLRIHTVTVTLRRHDPTGTLVPWDSRTECLRRLPLEISIKPDCLHNECLFSYLMAQGRSLPPAEWLESILSGICTYLTCLHTVWTEIIQLKEQHSDHMQGSITRGGINDHGVCAEMICWSSAWGEKAMGILPKLELLVPPEYPVQQPTYRLVDIKEGLPSAKAFSDRLTLNIASTAAPLSFSHIVECWLEACWNALDSE